MEEVSAGSTLDALGLTMTIFPAVHGALRDALSIRIEDSRDIFAYSGNSIWTDAMLEASRLADLFVIECYSDGVGNARASWLTRTAAKPAAH